MMNYLTFSLGKQYDLTLDQDGTARLYPQEAQKHPPFPCHWLTVSYPYEAWGILHDTKPVLSNFVETLKEEVKAMLDDAEESIKTNDLKAIVDEPTYHYCQLNDGTFRINIHASYCYEEGHEGDEYAQIIVHCDLTTFELLKEHSSEQWYRL